MQKTMSVPLNDLQGQYKNIKEEVDEAVLRVLEKQNCVLGEEVAAFEEKVAAYIGTPYALGVSSGTDALIVSLMALGIGAGDEVITTPFTFFATATAILRVGAKLVLVDIEADSFNIDPNKIEKKITDKTKAIVPVHLYGQSADMGPIMALAKKHGLAVIEDAAQSIGATYNKKRVGSFGDAGCFSFFPAKNLGCAGDGGIVTLKDKELYDKINAMRNHGSTKRYYYNMLGGNFRLDTIQAAILLVKFKYIEEWSEKRRTAAKKYRELFAGVHQIKIPKEVFSKSVYNQFVLRLKDRDGLMEYLREHGVFSAVYYPVPIHKQKALQDIEEMNEAFPVSEEAAEEVLAIPIFPEIREEQQEYLVEQVKNFYNR